MGEHRCQWLEAAECASLRLTFFRANERVREPLRALHLHLFMMCRAQFAAERSFERYREAARTTPAIDGLLLQYLEAHAFLVSAKLAWDTLAGIKLSLASLQPPKGTMEAFRSAAARHATVRARLDSARHHIEHIVERIREGGATRTTQASSTDAFQQALGRCDGSALVFGDARFDLGEQLAALADLQGTVGPAIAGAVVPTFAVQRSAAPNSAPPSS